MNKKEFNFDRNLSLEELSDYEITKDLKINFNGRPNRYGKSRRVF